MSYAAIIRSAASEAQGILAQIGGTSSATEPNFIGPDGKEYVMVFRAADAFEQQAAGMEMQAHGFPDKSLIIATATRTQFTAAPLGWRRMRGTRLLPAPPVETLVLSIALDDPLFYVFHLVVHQPRGGLTSG